LGLRGELGYDSTVSNGGWPSQAGEVRFWGLPSRIPRTGTGGGGLEAGWRHRSIARISSDFRPGEYSWQSAVRSRAGLPHHGTDCRDVICTNTTVESALEISGLSLRMERGAQRAPCLDWTSGVLSLERAERRPLCFSDPSWRRSDSCTFLRDIVNSSQHNLTTMDTASSGQDGQAHHVFSDSMARCRTYL
jgi:hypothetical protein